MCLGRDTGKIHLGTDAWTSPNNRSFIGVTIQYENEGVIHSYVLDVVELPRRHTGQRLAEYLAQVVENFGLQDKVSVLTILNNSHSPS